MTSSKGTITQALSGWVIDRMEARFRAEAPADDAIYRTLEIRWTATACLLDHPVVFKAVVGSLGTAGPKPRVVRLRSRALWELALGDLAGISEDLRGRARAILTDQIAITFSGCLSFWIAGEIADEGLSSAVGTATATALLGFTAPRHRERVLAAMTLDATPGGPAGGPE
ncbi:hypothetical protein ASG52_25180 [Methylobacterium sp. Leaf456]|uniref:hypothetical protein n=1 Tax=Methylobacterium sp. Leaf456 TaxID=1736382 RepID=UPI0006F7B5CB|nr:hypothetical protein [Methylobacterium sp. Leaf456]KQT55061.1 hypothetical protein ASG52_25180 [Methylobacterium sp. Leaf456]